MVFRKPETHITPSGLLLQNTTKSNLFINFAVKDIPHDLSSH